MSTDIISKLEEYMFEGKTEDMEVELSFFKGHIKNTSPEYVKVKLGEFFSDMRPVRIPLNVWRERKAGKKKEFKEIKEACDNWLFGKLNGTRGGANLVQYNGLVIDIDKKQGGAGAFKAKDLAQIEEAIESLGLCAVVHTTLQHVDANDTRVRIVLPFKDPLPLEGEGTKIYGAVYNKVCEVLKAQSRDDAGHSASQGFFCPCYRVLEDPVEFCAPAERFVKFIQGKFLLRWQDYNTLFDGSRRTAIRSQAIGARKRGEIEDSYEATLAYMSKLAADVGDAESFDTSTLENLAKWIFDTIEYGKFKPRKRKKEGSAAGKKVITYENYDEMFADMAPKYYWRTNEYKFKDPFTGETRVFREKSDPRVCALYIEQKFGVTISMQVIKDHFFAIADKPENEVDAFKERLDSLVWDGKPRIENLVTLKEGTEYPEMRKLFIRKWFISIMARTYRPGEKVDTMLVFLGRQGLKKSTFFESILGHDYYTDSVQNLDKMQDVLMKIRGKVVSEFAEMEAMTKKDHIALKGFLSQRADDTRDPYDRRVSRHERTVVFCGSTNEENFLRDTTGNRRFWVVPIADRKFEALSQDEADQILAEAKSYFLWGEKWYFDMEEDVVSVMNCEYLPEDPIHSMVTDAVTKGMLPQGHFHATELCKVLCLDPHKGATKVAQALRKLGFVYKTRAAGEARFKGFNSGDRE